MLTNVWNMETVGRSDSVFTGIIAHLCILIKSFCLSASLTNSLPLSPEQKFS